MGRSEWIFFYFTIVHTRA
uniref:Uncharacterized protein n=1 Tax=Arundo donax TaxID=35708 RepID=A0A0A9A5I9_ARUDO